MRKKATGAIEIEDSRIPSKLTMLKKEAFSQGSSRKKIFLYSKTPNCQEYPKLKKSEGWLYQKKLKYL